jgi:hypothetical protein
MNTQHTPGPWKVSGCCHVRSNYIGQWIHESIIATEDDFFPNPCVARVECREYRSTQGEAYKPDPEQLANARLIAAAPDLLAALQEVELRLTQARIASNIGRPTLKDADFLRNECERTAAFAREVINKATGN